MDISTTTVSVTSILSSLMSNTIIMNSISGFIGITGIPYIVSQLKKWYPNMPYLLKLLSSEILGIFGWLVAGFTSGQIKDKSSMYAFIAIGIANGSIASKYRDVFRYFVPSQEISQQVIDVSKKISIIMIIILSFISIGYCDLLDNLKNNITASTFANLKEPMSICYGGTTSLIGYRLDNSSSTPFILSLDLGIITDAQKLATGLGIGINIGEAFKKYTHFDFNSILKNGRIGGYIAKYQWENRTIDMAGVYIGEMIGK